jgi:LmbE family N-acetylglucosaminyl deacetylase
VQRLLAVCAHPDDESFGLGAVLAAFSAAGTHTAVVCFTQGEASTLGATTNLGAVRAGELAAAAHVLGVARVELLAYPDGGLSAAPLDELAAQVGQAAAAHGAEALLVFDEGGISGHPDHCRATEAARVAARQSGYPVLAWALPQTVAAQLNAEYGTQFVGRDAADLDLMITVDRTRQRAAIACHASQSSSNPVLWRRLELLGDREWLRRLA